MWDIHTGTCLRVFQGHQRGIASLYFDGVRIVSGSSDATIRVYDAITGDCYISIPSSRQPRGLNFVEAHEAPSVLFAVDRSGPAATDVTGHGDLVRTLQCDQDFIVSGSYDEKVSVFDASNGSLVLDLHAHSGRVFCLAFDSTRLISCSQTAGEELRVFDFYLGDRSFLL